MGYTSACVGYTSACVRTCVRACVRVCVCIIVVVFNLLFAFTYFRLSLKSVVIFLTGEQEPQYRAV